MKTRYKLLFAIFIVAINACIDEFDPKLVGDRNQLVFDGTLTDETEQNFFKLSYSAGYNNKESIYERNVNSAKIWIIDAKNVRTDCEFLGNGSFVTPKNFRGQIGNSYSLHILNDGTEFVSKPELMKPTPPIEKIYAEFKEANLNANSKFRGYHNVYLDTKDPAKEGDYYRWSWINYQKTKICELWRQPDTPNIFSKACCENCWNINQCFGCVNIASDNLINGNTLRRQSITQIPYEAQTPYYLQVKQMSISKEAFDFWSIVDAQANNSGGIFDASPATIRGNIITKSTTSQPLIGYFQVSAVSKKIVYINRGDTKLSPFAVTEYPFTNDCKECRESLYRTKIKPEAWVD
jgi:Domain of unknown function (DUF4249)